MSRSLSMLCALAALPPCLAQEPTPAPTNGSNPLAVPATAIAVQRDLVALAKATFPGLVTVRTFVRGASEPTAAAGPSDPATPLPPTSGWIAAPSAERDYPGFRPHRHGSGFFVSKDGEVLTGLQPLQVQGEQLADLVEIETMDGHRVLCDVVGLEPTLGLAVLRGAVFPSWAKPDFRPLEFGDSDACEIGSIVLGCGDPLGPERYLGFGLLVAKPSRDCYQELMSATYMQATLFVPPGAFGGPLVGLDGKVLGLLSRLEIEGVGDLSTPGSAWALPSKILQGLYESIRTAGTTRSPWLGLSVMSRAEIATTRGLPVFQQMQKPPHGILIENVFTPSPAATAGLRPDDFLTHFGSVEIHAPVDFQRQLYLAGVGSTVELKFFRKGEVFTHSLSIEARPEAAKPR
ncbi:MAG: S1C family serine protease [Planctomycetes bacterium]|nr:S1C family serine protease [Planctomycetota bacterium]